MKYLVAMAGLLVALGSASAQTSPPATASGKVGDATLTVKYCAPSVRGRQIFGEGGRVMQDPTAPIWRAGANDATAFHVSADVTVEGLTVPKGNYTLYVDVKDPDNWQLVISKQTGQWGTSYDPAKDLGRVKMEMTKPPSSIETLRYTISSAGSKKGTLVLAWENHIATVPVTAD